MTEFFGAGDISDSHGNTFLLKCEDKENVYISGLEFLKFKTHDKSVNYISLTGNNMCPYTFSNGEKYAYFISTHYKFIENDKIEEGTLLNATSDILDPFDYHLENCGIDSFKKLRRSLLHTYWPGVEGIEEDEDDEDEDDVLVEEDETMIETKYCNGNNGVL